MYSRFRPCMMQVVRRDDRTHCVVATLHDDGRDLPQASHVFHERILRHEDVVLEVVRFDAREPERDDVAREVPTVSGLASNVEHDPS